MSMLQAIAVAALSASAILAQDITGTWQGKALSGAQQQRIVFKITRTEPGNLKVVLYNLDRGAHPQGASSAVLQGSTLKLSFALIEGTYEGKLSADGSSITGAWNLGGGSVPLNLTRATEETAWAIPTPSARLKPMRPDAAPGFEVATIKPSDPNRFNSGFKIDGQRIFTERESLRAMIMFAYGIHPRQILNAPSWADSDNYDVNGRADEPGEPNLEQMRNMYRKLLEDRFQLVCHRDKKELSVYLLVQGKNGAKLTRSEAKNAMPDQTMNGRGNLRETNASMAEFAGSLQAFNMVDRPVLDQTKLEGRFDFRLRWTPDQHPSDDPNAPPDLFTAMQEQLGLKLEATKAPADVLVIDKVERPSDN